MIVLIEAKNYRCLRYVRQKIGQFQVLVGPNASGKSTFLDVPALLGDVLLRGVTEPVRDRSADPRSLFWMHQGHSFELSVELAIPADLQAYLGKADLKHARFEMEIGFNEADELMIRSENLWLKPSGHPVGEGGQQHLIPSEPNYVVSPEGKSKPGKWKRIVSKTTGNDSFESETGKWKNSFSFGPLSSLEISIRPFVSGEERLTSEPCSLPECLDEQHVRV